ncbi:MAG TPA: DUF2905 domain-containing protein [Thermomicrobiales bacterium]|nr:DUF2905 domain-containing protein [Thermomicrobiales bacterium]
MDSRGVGLVIVVLGVAAVVVGLVVMTGALSWFGRLPGDIRIERGNSRIYIPLASMLLVSLALSLILTLIRRLMS